MTAFTQGPLHRCVYWSSAEDVSPASGTPLEAAVLFQQHKQKSVYLPRARVPVVPHAKLLLVQQHRAHRDVRADDAVGLRQVLLRQLHLRTEAANLPTCHDDCEMISGEQIVQNGFQ